MSFTYSYPRPAVSCDVVAFTMRHDDLAVLLVRRKGDPFRGAWALPGGFVNENESLERAATRELYEETGVSGARLEQLATFGDPGRDPRGHTITVAWLTFLLAEISIVAGDDAAEAAFVPLRSLELEGVPAARSLTVKTRPSAVRKPRDKSQSERIKLAFDHATIITKAYERLRRHLDEPLREIAFEFVPTRFTLAELRRTYEVCLGRSLSPQKIRKHLVDTGLVIPATRTPAPKPSTQLYRWNRR